MSSVISVINAGIVNKLAQVLIDPQSLLKG